MSTLFCEVAKQATAKTIGSITHQTLRKKRIKEKFPMSNLIENRLGLSTSSVPITAHRFRT